MGVIGGALGASKPKYEDVDRLALLNPPQLAMEMLQRSVGIAVFVLVHVFFEFCFNHAGDTGSVKLLHDLEC